MVSQVTRTKHPPTTISFLLVYQLPSTTPRNIAPPWLISIRPCLLSIRTKSMGSYIHGEQLNDIHEEPEASTSYAHSSPSDLSPPAALHRSISERPCLGISAASSNLLSSHPPPARQRSCSHVAVDFFDPMGVRRLSYSLATTPSRAGTEVEEAPSLGSEETVTVGEGFDFEKGLRQYLKK